MSGPGTALATVGGVRRTVYYQLDGEIILADECECDASSCLECPIDEHAIRARMRELQCESSSCVTVRKS